MFAGPDVLTRCLNNGDPMLYSVFTPAFTITHPHSDNCGSGHNVMTTYGVKLLLWWDWTDQVKEEYGKVHCLKKGDTLLSAVQSWPRLNWCILHPGQYKLLPPGTVHAVMSPVNSVASGHSFVKAEWLDDGTLKERMEWEMSLVEKRLRDPDWRKEGDPFGEGQPVDAMEKDLELWEIWLRSDMLNPEQNSNLKTLIHDLTGRMERVKEKDAKFKRRTRK